MKRICLFSNRYQSNRSNYSILRLEAFSDWFSDLSTYIYIYRLNFIIDYFEEKHHAIAPDARYPLNADFCLNRIRKGREGGRDGCKSCDTPARLLIQKEEEEAGAADKRRLPRSEPLWPGYKRENPGPVCLEAGRPARGNRSSAARSPESFLLSVVSPVRKRKRSPREEMEHGVQRRRSVSPSCVANARSCLFIGFTRRYGTAKKNISTTAGRPL